MALVHDAFARLQKKGGCRKRVNASQFANEDSQAAPTTTISNNSPDHLKRIHGTTMYQVETFELNLQLRHRRIPRRHFTDGKYLDVFVVCGILFRLHGFSRSEERRVGKE